MIVKFFNKSQPDIYVDDERGERLKRVLASDVKWLEIDDCMYATSAIASIAPGEQQTINTVHRIGGVADGTGGIHVDSAIPTLGISDEERERNVKRIQQMKADFLKRLEEKKLK